MMKLLSIFNRCVLLAMLVNTSCAFGQVRTNLVQKSIDDFLTETDSLFVETKNFERLGASYLIRFCDVRMGVDMKISRYGALELTRDSIKSHIFSTPTVRGDIFADLPKYQDSLFVVTSKRALSKRERRIVSQIHEIEGFFSQNVLIDGRPFYPHNRIESLVICNGSKEFFGLVKYGKLQLNLDSFTSSNKKILEKILEFVF